MQALIFSQLSQLVAFVSAFERDLAFSQTFTLWGLKTVEAEKTYLALTHYRKSGLLKHLDLGSLEGELEAPPSLSPQSQLKLTVPDEEASYCTVIFCHEETQVQSLLPLQPWLKGPPALATEQPIIFWVKNSSLALDLVVDHFKVGCEHIEYISIKTTQDTSFIFKIQQPSYYLIQRHAKMSSATNSERDVSLFEDLIDRQQTRPDDLHHQISVYYPFKENIYLEWGFEPILSERWLNGLQQDSQSLLLLSHHLFSTPVVFEQSSWSSIYELTSFELKSTASTDWQVSKDHSLRFKVPLSLEKRSRAVDPELWLIAATQFDELEQRLSLVDEEDLSKLLISIQQKKEEQPETQQEGTQSELHFFVRERSGKTGKSYLDIGGQRFASYMGFHNLFLPVDVELQPRLRRDQYPTLFGLKQQQITVLTLPQTIEPTRPLLEQATLYHFSNQSFEPIGELVHYIVTSGNQTFEQAKKNSIFTLSKYSTLPSLLAEPRYSELKTLLTSIQPQAIVRSATSKDSKETKEISKAATKLSIETKQADKGIAEAHSPQEQKSEINTKKKIAKLSKVNGLETQISKLMATLLSDKGQKLPRPEDQWFEVAELLKKLKEYRSAIEALTEVFWLTRREYGFGNLAIQSLAADSLPLRYRVLFSTIVQRQYSDQNSSEVKLEKLPLTQLIENLIKDPLNSNSYHAACYCLIQIEALPHDKRYDPLSRLIDLLQSESARWRKKEHWLLALGTARLVQDQRLLARHRELLLTEVTKNGVERRDLPSLVVEYLYSTRLSQSSQTDEDGQDGISDLEKGLSYLELIKTKLIKPNAQSSISWLKAPLLTLLARTYHEYQLYDLREQTLNELYPMIKQVRSTTTKAWILIILTRTKGLVNQKLAQAYSEQYVEIAQNLSPNDVEHVKAVLQNIVKRTQQQRAKERSELSRNQTKHRLLLSFKPQNYPEIQTLYLELVDSLNRSDSKLVQARFKALLMALIKWAKAKDDHQLIAYYLHQINELAGKVKWLIENNLFLNQFIKLDEILKGNLKTSTEAPFFINLCFLTLSELQLRLGNHHFAEKQIEWLLEQIKDNHNFIDYLDSSSMTLQSIESVDYHHRRPLLEMLLTNLCTTMDQSYLLTEILICNFIEQIVEVSMSKDQLIANRFQDYNDHEELSIRDALFNDQL